MQSVRRPRQAKFVVSLVVAFVSLACLRMQGARAEVCDAYGGLDDGIAAVLRLTAERLNIAAPTTWTLEAAAAFAQQHLTRPPGAERRSAAAQDRYRVLYARLTASERDYIATLLQEAGFVDAVPSPPGRVDYVLINGSTAPSVRERINSVAEAVRNGELTITDETELYVVDGERPLFVSETSRVLLDASPFEMDPDWVAPRRLPNDERAMNEMLWAQILLPDVLREHEIVFIHASKRPPAERAHTVDAVAQWAKIRRPTGGVALIVSNNPHIEYQRRITELTLRDHGIVDVCVVGMGPAASFDNLDTPLSLGIALDSLAGTLATAAKYYGVSHHER